MLPEPWVRLLLPWQPAAQESQESSGDGVNEAGPDNGNDGEKAASPPAKPSQAAGVVAHVKSETGHLVHSIPTNE